MITIIAAAIALVALSLMAWGFTRAYARQRLLDARIEGLMVNLTAAPATDRVPRPKTLEGERAPGFDLPTLAGERLTLQALLAAGKPLLLVFADPRCGPCYEILPDIGGWQRVYGERLTIALVSNGDTRQNTAMTAGYGIDPLLLQHDLEVVNAYGLVQGPAAVLIQPDGRISAGPCYGTRAIRQLV
ncbi:MAG TPA: redoxin domain-containing protein, partial [Thermomicrobiales bacterium]|nr:redoxin domain-containing protein [Thermomicrobiales bacterium]